MKHLKEQIMKVIFFIAACTSVLAVALICIFLFANGLPAMEKIGLGKFLTGVIWKPSNNIFGILPMIMGSIYVTAGAIIIGVPIGLCTAVFMAHYCPKKIYGICKAAVNLMAGVPSVQSYGFFGTGTYRATHAGLDRTRWLYHADSIHLTWHHDPADHCQRL